MEDTAEKAVSKLPSECDPADHRVFCPPGSYNPAAEWVWHHAGPLQQGKIMKVLLQQNWLLKETLWYPDDRGQGQSFDGGGMGCWQVLPEPHPVSVQGDRCRAATKDHFQLINTFFDLQICDNTHLKAQGDVFNYLVLSNNHFKIQRYSFQYNIKPRKA